MRLACGLASPPQVTAKIPAELALADDDAVARRKISRKFPTECGNSCPLLSLGVVTPRDGALRRQLEAEGVRKFIEPFDQLQAGLRRKLAFGAPVVSQHKH